MYYVKQLKWQTLLLYVYWSIFSRENTSAVSTLFVKEEQDNKRTYRKEEIETYKVYKLCIDKLRFVFESI